MIKRVLAMSAVAGLVGLMAYTFAPTPADAVQVNFRLSADSHMILAKQGDKKSSGKSIKKSSGKSSGKSFKKSSGKSFKKSSGKWGKGGNWQRHGRWHRGNRWGGGFWRGGVWILTPFVIGDPCYDYVERWPGGPRAWVYICGY